MPTLHTSCGILSNGPALTTRADVVSAVTDACDIRNVRVCSWRGGSRQATWSEVQSVLGPAPLACDAVPGRTWERVTQVGQADAAVDDATAAVLAGYFQSGERAYELTDAQLADVHVTGDEYVRLGDGSVYKPYPKCECRPPADPSNPYGTQVESTRYRALQDRLASLVADGDLRTALRAHETQLEALRGTVNDSFARHLARIGNAETNLASHIDSLNKHSTRLGTAESQLATHADTLAGHTTRLGTAESQLATHADSLAGHSTRLGTAESQLATHADSLAGHSTRLGTAESQLASHTQSLTDHSSQLATHIDTLTDHSSQLATHSQSLTDHSAAWTALGSAV
jgi:ABC-type transporter Mla subunit MlaD